MTSNDTPAFRAARAKEDRDAKRRESEAREVRDRARRLARKLAGRRISLDREFRT